MRITNTMMMKQTLRNVGKSKNSLNTAENQLATEKKITRPSDDPIVAIRALSLRSSLSEIEQYLKHNIPDAESWMDVTETALNNMDAVFTDIYQYCNQGASDQFTVSDRSAIIDVLKQYKTALYSEANADYAGRYCFTGYKTDSPFTFLSTTTADRKYVINQNFTREDILTTDVMKGSVDSTTITNIDAADRPESEEVYRLRLAYQGCSGTMDDGSTPDFTVTAKDGTVTTYTPEAVTRKEFEKLVTDGTFAGETDKVYYIYDTGELAFTGDLYDSFNNAESMSYKYQKNSFQVGDPRPEMYFNCTDITDAANPIEYTLNADGQAISYNVNFSQSIQVNSLGKDALSYDIARDIDDMCSALQAVLDVETKLAKLKEMKDSNSYSDTEKAAIESMITATEEEHDYAVNAMKKLFSQELTKVKKYQQNVDLELADLGARGTRLALTKSRLSEQHTTFSDLKSKNEDVELEDVIIQYSSSQTLYQAALNAASGCVQKSLLDYI